MVPALIWIKNRALNFADLFLMTESRRPAIRHCPICRVAMQAAKSPPEIADFAMFRCLTCETTIREAKSPARARESGPED